MKLKYFLIGFLLLIPSVLAANEDGKITAGKDLWIVDVDVKVDGLSSRNLDYDAEIGREAKPSSIIKIDFGIRNNNSGLTMEDVVGVVTIDDLDIDKTTNSFDINPSSDKDFSVEFTLPSDAEESTYEIMAEFEGELNNSIHKVEYALDLVVEKSSTTSTSSNPSLVNEINNSISNLCGEFKNYYKSYIDEKGRADKCESQLTSKDQNIATLQTYQTQFTTCESQKSSVESQIFGYQNTMMDYQINITNCQQAIKDEKNSKIFWIIGVLVIIGGVYIWRTKIKNPDSSAQSESGK